MIHSAGQDIIQLCVEKLKTIYGSHLRLTGNQSVGGGCINHAVRISTSEGLFFLKWNDSVPSDLFLKEAAGLSEMRSAENNYLIIPEVIWNREADQFPGLLLMEYLAPAINTMGFDERLGRGIAQLHRKTSTNFGFYHSNYCGKTIQDNTWTDNWPEFFARRRIWALVLQIKINRGMSADDQKIYERLAERIPQFVSHQTVPSLIHGDLWSGNYLFTAKGPALIDPACYYADREMELGMMKLFGGFSMRVWSAYQEEFPLPEGWNERVRLYQLYHLLNHYLLFGGSYREQAIKIAKEYI